MIFLASLGNSQGYYKAKEEYSAEDGNGVEDPWLRVTLRFGIVSKAIQGLIHSSCLIEAFPITVVTNEHAFGTKPAAHGGVGQRFICISIT